MELFRLRQTDQNDFEVLPEIAMDCQFAKTREGVISPAELYVVIGCIVAIRLNEKTFAEPETGFFEQRWWNRDASVEDREKEFSNWLNDLGEAPPLSNLPPGSQLFLGGMGPTDGSAREVLNLHKQRG